MFSRHPLLLQTAYSDLKRQALEQSSILIGTAGSVGTREVGGRSFFYRQFYDAEGAKAARYIGSTSDPTAIARARELRDQIALTKTLVKDARQLTERGYVRTDQRAGAVVSALFNRGLFRVGALLVGSHAYGALLNELGVRAAAFSTEDIDIARGEPLELALDGDDSFEQMLRESTVRLSPVPSLDRKAAPTSYKAAGADRLRVDLLVPATGSDVTTRRVPELRAHATALPYLRYVLTDPRDALLLTRDGVIPVCVPRAERLAWHKMLVAQRRGATSEKRAKDLLQASVLFAVLAEDAPDALEEALSSVPRAAKSATRSGAALVLRKLTESGLARAAELMAELVSA